MCHFFLVFFSPFSIAITSLGEQRANLSAFRTFVRFVLVWICRFTLPLGVWEGLRFVIVALPGLFSYHFFHEISLITKKKKKQICNKRSTISSHRNTYSLPIKFSSKSNKNIIKKINKGHEYSEFCLLHRLGQFFWGFRI